MHPTPSACSSADKNFLKFDETMAHFDAMFPNLGSSVIEMVLRKNDGDVSATIDELLQRSAKTRSNTPPTETQEAQRRKREEKERTRDPCANDEKIALLIQNREFLRYLRRDPNFQRELLGPLSSNLRNGKRTRHGHHSSSRMGHSSEHPILLASSHPSQSSNTCRFFRASPNVVTMPAAAAVMAHRVPDGPSVEFRALEQEFALPQGPLIDYVDTEQHTVSGWAQRLKAKLTPTAAEKYEPLADLTDEELRARIDGMGRGGKGLLLALAKKFGQMTKGGGGENHQKI